MAVAQGVSVASGSEMIDVQFMDAICDTEDQAEVMAAKANMERMKAVTLAKYARR